MKKFIAFLCFISVSQSYSMENVIDITESNEDHSVNFINDASNNSQIDKADLIARIKRIRDLFKLELEDFEVDFSDPNLKKQIELTNTNCLHLPSSYGDLTPEALDFAIAHEMAHIKQTKSGVHSRLLFNKRHEKKLIAFLYLFCLFYTLIAAIDNQTYATITVHFLTLWTVYRFHIHDIGEIEHEADILATIALQNKDNAKAYFNELNESAIKCSGPCIFKLQDPILSRISTNPAIRERIEKIERLILENPGMNLEEFDYEGYAWKLIEEKTEKQD